MEQIELVAHAKGFDERLQLHFRQTVVGHSQGVGEEQKAKGVGLSGCRNHKRPVNA